MSLVHRVMPQSLEAEVGALGAMLSEPEHAARGLEVLAPQVFYPETHQHIFSAIRNVAAAGNRVDIITVAIELREAGLLEKCGNTEFLSQLIGAWPGTPIDAYIRVLLEKAALRELLFATDQIRERVYSGGKAAELVSEAQRRVLSISATARAGELVALDSLLLPEFSDLVHRMENPGEPTGTPTGFYDLDAILGNLQPAQLYVVGARPKMGKSAFLLQIARYVAQRLNLPTAFFSLEMTGFQLLRRMLCSEAEINSLDYRTAYLTDEEKGRLADAFNALRHVPLFIDQQRGLSVMDIATRAQRLAAQHGQLGLLVVDYLQLVSAENDRAPRHEQVGTIARDLAKLAGQLGCPVLAAVQLSRKVEDREDKRPRMSDCRESGDIEANAYAGMFLYRDGYYKRQRAKLTGVPEEAAFINDDTCEVIVDAHRDGPTGTAILGWQGQHVRFLNPERRAVTGSIFD